MDRLPQMLRRRVSTLDASPLVPDGSGNGLADLRTANNALLPLLALGLLAAVCVGWRANATAGVLLWCVACLVVGGSIGFLFGIPKAAPSSAAAPAARSATDAAGATARPRSEESLRTRPNTNLEEVSDWLTKIIVGLSLVHVKDIDTYLGAISRNAAATLRAQPGDTDLSMATALVVGFAVLGFLCGYIYTRLFLQGAFGRSDGRLLLQFEAELARALSNVPAAAADPNQEPVAPSLSERASAERVARAAPAGQPELVLAPLRALAAEYAQVRRDMPFGIDRTRRMGEIVGRMRPLSIAAKPYLSLLMQSQEPGERLAAVVCLEMEFDSQHITWLADRLHEEVAFIGYRAASVLLARAMVEGPPVRHRIREAVEAALRKGIQPEAERDKKVRELMDELSRDR